MVDGGGVMVFAATGYVEQVSAVAGQTTSLACDDTALTDNDHAVLVLWYKNHQSTPLYSFDARSSKSFLTEQKTRPSSSSSSFASRDNYGARVTFARAPNSALRISPLRADDQAVYRCRVDFHLGPTRNVLVNLSVAVAPSTPRLFFNNSEVVGDVVGPLLYHKSINLSCLSQDGRPASSVGWFDGTSLLDQSFSVLAANVSAITADPLGGRQCSDCSTVVNHIQLEAPSRQRSSPNITCQAVNSASLAPASRHIRVIFYFEPEHVMLAEGSEADVLQAGDRHTARCITTGSIPPANISWTLSDTALKHHRQTISAHNQTTIGQVSFTVSKQHHGALLLCTASNAFFPHKNIHASRRLNVQYSPSVRAQLGFALNERNVREGSDVYFDCKTDANPKATGITWLLNGRYLGRSTLSAVRESSDIVSTAGASLIIRNISRHSSGNYSCRAANRLGTSTSASVPLRIRHSPVCARRQQVHYGGAVNELVQVRCHVHAHPSQVSFQWQLNRSSELFDMPSSQVKSMGLTSTLMHTPRSRFDFGILLCWAYNSVGRLQAPCVFHITMNGRPEPPSECYIHNKTGAALHVKCTAGHDGGLSQSFVAELSGSHSGQLLANVSRNEPDFQLSRLPTDTPLHVRLYAVNRLGVSAATEISGFHVEAASTHGWPGNMNAEANLSDQLPMLPLYVVFIVAAVAMVAIAVVATVCLHRTRGGATPV